MGGGIYNEGGTVTLNDSARVNRNRGYSGGGIYNDGGMVTLNGSARVNNNKASNSGGGIYNNGGTLVGAIAGANVKSNIPDDIAP